MKESWDVQFCFLRTNVSDERDLALKTTQVLMRILAVLKKNKLPISLHKEQILNILQSEKLTYIDTGQ